jgi:uncharacterized protein (TIGR02453 family)
MATGSGFDGFPKGSVAFYRDLKRNNEKVWFENNRFRFDDFVLDPARQFIGAMGAKLSRMAPQINADPRIDRSIFRIHRDTRFSQDKTPYKTHLGIWFWEGERKRMECSGFYLHMEPSIIGIYAGIYIFPNWMLPEYRDSVVDKRHGKTLKRAINTALKLPGASVGDTHYKRIPRGYDPEHENAAYLLHNGFGVGLEQPIPPEFYSGDLINWCYERWKTMVPVHKWLRDMAGRAAEKQADKS